MMNNDFPLSTVETAYQKKDSNNENESVNYNIGIDSCMYQ